MRSTGAGGPRALLALLAAVFVVAGIGVTGGFAPLAEHSDHDGEPPTTWRVDVREDGDARVTITMRFRLATENETRGFERLAGEFENGTADVLSVATFERAAKLAAGETNRPMGIQAVAQSTAIENDTGRLVLAFTWTNFARASGDQLAVGDVFQSPTGSWLPRLTDRQEMVIDFPPQYAPESLTWPLRDGAVFIDGPETFASGEPSVTFEEVSPNVSVREATLDRTVVRVGEPVGVTATVENTGREAGTETLELRAYGETVETRTVTVDPESSRTVTFTRAFDLAGRVPISVSGVEAGTLSVEEPPANLSIVSATLDRERIRPGERATVRVTVVNDGGENGTLPLTLSVNGSVAATANATVEAGGSETVTLNRTIEETGTFRLAVNGVEAGLLTVEGATPTGSTPPTTTAPPPTAGPPTTTAPPATSPPTTGPGSPDEEGFGPLVVVLLVIAVLGVVAYAVQQRESGVAGAATTDGEGGGPGGSAADGSAPESAASGAAVATETGDANAGDGEGNPGDEEEAGAPLLSDEEQVLALLRENDGRMKQAAIVDATDWSNAKVSQLLSGMADDGEVRKLRIGRENLITLPEEAPGGAE